MKHTTASFLLTTGLAACLASAAAAQDNERRLVIVTTGGAFEAALAENFYEQFTEETGIRIVPVSANVGEQSARVRLMAETGQVEWDIISAQAEDVTGSFTQYLASLGAECELVPEAAAAVIDGACQEYGILRSVGGGVLSFDTTAFPDGGPQPQSWADFWNTEDFPGPRGMADAGVPWWVLSVALLADGVPPDEIFPLDLDRAFAKLDEIKPEITLWWRSGDQSQQAFRTQEVVMSMLFSGRAVSLLKESVPIGYSWDGAPKDLAYWAVLEGAPNSEEALEFIDFFYRNTEAHLGFSDAINYDTASSAAIELLAPEDRARSAVEPENWAAMLDMDSVWIAENRELIIQRWTEWLSE